MPGLWLGSSPESLVARCQGFWNRGAGRVVQNSCRRHFTMVLGHHKQSGRALRPSFWKIWWLGYSYGQYHPAIGDTVNACIRHPEYKASYTGRIGNVPINVKWIANLQTMFANKYETNWQLANKYETNYQHANKCEMNCQLANKYATNCHIANKCEWIAAAELDVQSMRKIRRHDAW